MAVSLFSQIRDDFLGRQIIHFDFTDSNPDTQPLVVGLSACLSVGLFVCLSVCLSVSDFYLHYMTMYFEVYLPSCCP